MSLPRPFLVIPAETRSRELDAKLLLACAAAERGFRVVLGERKAIGLHVTRLPRGIFLAKGVTPRQRRLLRILRDLGFALVCADEEGLVHPGEAHYLRTKVGPEVLGMADALLAWGPENARIWREAPGYAGAPIHATGNPRTDLLRPELRRFFADEAAALRARYGRFLMVNTNFSRLNHYYPHLSWQQRMLDGSEAPPPGAEAFELGLARHRKAIFDAFVAVVPRLARAAGDAALVVRPHPSESHEVWRAAGAGHANVHVVYEGNVVPWLMAAEATVHNGCTTGLETHLLGGAAIAYRPLADDAFDNALPNGVSFQAFSAEALESRVREALAGRLAASTAEREARAKLLSLHLAALEGPLAADRIVDVLEGVAATARAHRPSLLDRTRAHVRAARRSRKKRAEARRPGTRNRPEYVEHIFPPIEAAALETRIDRFRELLGRFDGVGVRPLLPNVFEIRRGPAPER